MGMILLLGISSETGVRALSGATRKSSVYGNHDAINWKDKKDANIKTEIFHYSISKCTYHPIIN